MHSIKRLGAMHLITLICCIASSVVQANPLEIAKQKSHQIFHNQFKDLCYLLEEGEKQPVELHTIQSNSKDDNITQQILIGYSCHRAAYNTSEVWILTDQYGQTQPLSFAQPAVTFKFQGEGERKLKSWKLEGMISVPSLSGSGFDPGSMQLSTSHKWRGLGDASENGIYKYINGRFVLVEYEIDPTYDEEVNPVTIISYPGPVQ